MKLSDLSINRAVTFSMIFIAIAAFGLVSLARLSPELLPDITFPVVSVIVSYEGVGPEDIERLVARPIEETLSTVTNINEVSSTCREGVVITMLMFDWGTDMDAATADVRERLDLVKDFLPQDSDEPVIFKFDVSMEPIVYLGISSDTLEPAEIRKLSENEVEPILERLEGVAMASTLGGAKREIQVQIDRSKMEAHNLSINQVTNALRSENINMPAGDIYEDKFNPLLRTVAEFTSVEQLSNVVVSYQDGAPIYVKDIAQVYDTYSDRNQVIRLNGQPAVTLYLQKQAGANTVEVVDKAKEAIKELEKKFEGNIDVNFTVIMDQSRFIKRSLGNLTNVAVIGAVLAVVVLFFFLHNIRSVIIIALAIPMSIVATFLAMDAGGITLNMLSMGGLALGIGMLVDNAVVVLENVFRHREEGEDRKTAASRGTSEVSTAIIASTMTTISVFLPIVFVPGIAGVMFEDQALTVTFSLACSLLVALTLVPLLCSRFLSLESESRRIRLLSNLSRAVGLCMEKLDDFYQNVLNWALDHRKLVVLIIVVLFIMSIAIVWPLKLVGTEFIPDMDQGQIYLTVETSPGTSLEFTEKAIQQIENIIMDVAGKDLDSVFTNAGSGEGFTALFSGGGSHSATINIILVDPEKRERSQNEIERAIKDRLAEVPGIKLAGSGDPGAEMMGFGGSPVDIEIYGYDRNLAQELANKIKDMVQNIEGTVDVQTTIEKASPETQIIVDRDRAYSMGLNVASIASQVQANVKGTVATRFREGGDEYDVLVRLKEKDRVNMEDVYNIPIISPMMQEIPLKNVAKLKSADSPVAIERKDQERIVRVIADLKGRDLGSVTNDIRKGLESIEVPEGFIVQIGGSGQEQAESFQWLGLALIGAVFLVYAVMASLFESLLDPFIIMFTFPLALIGVVWTFFFSGTIFSIIAFVGVIMLAGIVVNNAIVMVDYINQLRDRGMELREAIVQGGRIRLRPVLITALTTILAMVPLALGVGSGSEIRYPMARAVVGGLSVSTVLTLVVVPVIYSVFESLSGKWKERHERKRAERAERIAAQHEIDE